MRGPAAITLLLATFAAGIAIGLAVNPPALKREADPTHQWQPGSWRRTVNGWERTDDWGVCLHHPPPPKHATAHPLLLALTELSISLAALALQKKGTLKRNARRQQPRQHSRPALPRRCPMQRGTW